MKKLMIKYQLSKYRKFHSGLIFAIITIVAITLCITHIVDQGSSKYEVYLPFIIALASLFMGFIAMFYESPKGKLKKNML